MPNNNTIVSLCRCSTLMTMNYWCYNRVTAHTAGESLMSRLLAMPSSIGCDLRQTYFGMSDGRGLQLHTSSSTQQPLRLN